jgi:two-component system response regulator (stage 0 sporulation protein F)
LQDITVNHRSILIIDDNEQIRTFLRKVLEQAGYMVTEAPNGQEGLRQFRQTPTALVITDLLMPDSDGLEVTIALHRESPTVKIIVLTGGSGQRDFLEVAKLLGAHRTMRKPVTITELLQAVQQELQEGSRLKGHGPQGEQ